MSNLEYTKKIKDYGNNSYMISVLHGLFHTPGFLVAFYDVVESINNYIIIQYIVFKK